MRSPFVGERSGFVVIATLDEADEFQVRKADG